MDVTEYWATVLVDTEERTGKRYKVGEKLTEFDGREKTADMTGGEHGRVLRGEKVDNPRMFQIPWTYVTEEIRELADREKRGKINEDPSSI